MIDFRELVKKGVHFGHQTSRWCPKMEPYIWGRKNKTHLINVAITASQLEQAARFLEEVAAQGSTILWVGTKRSAQDAIEKAADKLNMSRVTHRWIGGTICNFSQVKKSVTKLLHFEDVLNKSETTDQFAHYTKKELSLFHKKVARLKKSVGGIRHLAFPIGAIVLVDINKENAALHEAVQMKIPVVAIVDTNCDPSLVDYVIPANDDSPQSVALLIEYLADAAQRGVVKAGDKKQAQQQKEQEAQAGAAPDESLRDVAGVLSLVTEDEDQSNARKNKKTTAHPLKPGSAKRVRITESEE